MVLDLNSVHAVTGSRADAPRVARRHRGGAVKALGVHAGMLAGADGINDRRSTPTWKLAGQTRNPPRRQTTKTHHRGLLPVAD